MKLMAFVHIVAGLCIGFQGGIAFQPDYWVYEDQLACGGQSLSTLGLSHADCLEHCRKESASHAYAAWDDRDPANGVCHCATRDECSGSKAPTKTPSVFLYHHRDSVTVDTGVWLYVDAMFCGLPADQKKTFADKIDCLNHCQDAKTGLAVFDRRDADRPVCECADENCELIEIKSQRAKDAIQRFMRIVPGKK